MVNKGSFSKLAICTRFNDGTDDKSLTPFILSWLEAVKAIDPGQIIILVPTEFDKHDSVQMLRELGTPNLHVLPIHSVKIKAPNDDTGSRRRNSPMLNAMVDKAVECEAEHFMSMSIHHSITADGVQHLLRHMDNGTACVGPALYVHEEHRQPGHQVDGHGGTCPINTLMIWNLKYLGPLGFPLIVDAASDRHYSENEELVTIAVMKQVFRAANLTAKLVSVPGITRSHDWYSMFPDRENKYTAKGKTEQMHWQCDQLGLPYPRIVHT